MGNVNSTRHNIKLVDIPNIPGVDFAHFTGEHPTNCWSGNVEHNMCKINFFIEGRPYIIVNGRSYAVAPGDIMIYHPHDIHYGNIPCEQYIEYYQLQFEPEALTCLTGGSELIELFCDKNSNVVQMHPSESSRRAIKKAFEKLLITLEKETEAKSITPLMELIETLRLISDCKEYHTEPIEQGFYPDVLLGAIRFIDQNYGENITTAEVSEAVFVSRSYLNKLFQKYLDLPIHKYILLLRISKACRLLSEGASVTDTAMEVGFESSTSFSGAFKSVCKISPSEFRKQHFKKPV